MIILGRRFNTTFNEQAPDDGGQGGGQGDGNKPPQDQPNLDENGNPVEPQKPEPTKDEPKPEDKPTVDFNSPVVEQVSNLVKDAGLNPQEVAKAVTDNDGQITPAIMKALVEKHGESVASIIANQLGTFHKAGIEQAKNRDEAVFNQVKEAFKDVTDQSGEDTWKELSTWAKDNVPNEDRKQINKLLQQGGLAAQYAINDLVNRFKSSSNFTQEADLLSGDNLSNDNGVQPLSREEYTRELKALEAKGHVYGQSQEMAKLDKRRQAGLARGI